MSSAKRTGFDNVNPNVFISSVAVIILFIAVVLIAPDAFDLLTKKLNVWITTSFSWFYVLAVAIF